MHQLSSRALADMLAALAVAPDLIEAAPVAPRHADPRPFAKREDGRARRTMRRQVRAAKSAWLNS